MQIKSMTVEQLQKRLSYLTVTRPSSREISYIKFQLKKKSPPKKKRSTTRKRISKVKAE